MNFLTLAAKNLLRRRGRTFLTVLGVAIAITVLFSLLSLNSGYEKELNKEMEQPGRTHPGRAQRLPLRGGFV